MHEEAGDAEMSGLEDIFPPTFSVGLTQQTVGGPVLEEVNVSVPFYLFQLSPYLKVMKFMCGSICFRNQLLCILLRVPLN